MEIIKVQSKQRTVSLSCVIFFLFILFNTILANNSIIPDSIRTSNKNQIDYPVIELSGGVGIPWLFQANLTLSPYEPIYFQPRFSSSIIANEVGYVVGFQNRIKDNSIIRIGFGYSIGEFLSLDPGGKPGSQWDALYFRTGLLNK